LMMGKWCDEPQYFGRRLLINVLRALLVISCEAYARLVARICDLRIMIEGLSRYFLESLQIKISRKYSA
jgi:hypothetical protein